MRPVRRSGLAGAALAAAAATVVAAARPGAADGYAAAHAAIRERAAAAPPSNATAPDPFACNPLTDPGDFSLCMLPWPDDFFFTRSWDPAAPPGLTLTPASLPTDDSGATIDPVAGGFNAVGGASPTGPGLALLPVEPDLDASGLPRWWSIPDAPDAGGASLVLDAATLAPVAHWVELDHTSDADWSGGNYTRTLLVWPAARYAPNTTYIVALRRLVGSGGAGAVPPPAGFAALRDGTPTANPALEASRPRYERLFAALGAVGWARGELTLAWSFTTNALGNLTGGFLAMRDDALARVAADGGVRWAVTAVEDLPPPSNTSRRVHGSMWCPLYLPDGGVPSFHSRLVTNASTGLPVFQGYQPFDFEVVIPASVAAGGGPPAHVVLYGHGLFGTHAEVEGGYLADEAHAQRYVLAATDWIGLSAYDEPSVAMVMATDLSAFAVVPDRLHQGVLNFHCLSALLGQADFLGSANMTFAGGGPVASGAPADRHYNGNSQGGIMGTVYLATATDVTRGVLGVGGGPYALLLPRSKDFTDLFALLKARFASPTDRIALLALFQLLWDRQDPATYAPHVGAGAAGPLPGTPPHRAVWQYGLGDAQVTWLGAHMLAHSAGAVRFASQVPEGNESLAYIPAVPDGAVLTDGHAVVGFDFGLPLVPPVNTPPADGFDAHECPRRTPAGQAQMARFFYTGEIANTCGGPCSYPPPDGCAGG